MVSRRWWYRILTVVVALGYAGAVILVYGLVHALTGPVAEVVTIAVTAAIALLLAPLRARLQAAVNRWDHHGALVDAVNGAVRRPARGAGHGSP